MTEPSQPDTDSSTPIPWVAEKLHIYHDRTSTEFDNIAEFSYESDAEFAVRAANNHAMLLKALEGLIDSNFQHGMVKVTPEMFALIVQASNAIEEAKS